MGPVRRDFVERVRQQLGKRARPPPGAAANHRRGKMTQIAARFERIKALPAYELVADAIERKILGGILRPGDPIGTESELVKQFGVNRSTVREGIRLLEQAGLVARESNRRLL